MAQAIGVLAHDVRGEITSLSDERGGQGRNIRPGQPARGPSQVAATGRGDAYTALMDGLLQIEDCLDADGGIVLPPGVTLISLIDRNIANVGDSVAYRYLDFTGSAAGQTVELTWAELGVRLHAIGARVQRVAARGDRVAVLAPQGLDYVAGFFAAIKAGTIAVPLFAPELPGHAERLETALRDAQPTVVLTTAAAQDVVEAFLASCRLPRRPHVIVIDEIPDSAADAFAPVDTRHRRRLPSAVHRRARHDRRSAWRSPTARSAPTCCR